MNDIFNPRTNGLDTNRSSVWKHQGKTHTGNGHFQRSFPNASQDMCENKYSSWNSTCKGQLEKYGGRKYIQKVRAAGAQSLCKNMFRWVSNVHFSKAVMSYNQLANELGGLETHMKPKGLWLLEEKPCYRTSLCDILLSLQVQQISLSGEKSCHSNLQWPQVTSLGSTPHRKLNRQGYKVLLFK